MGTRGICSVCSRPDADQIDQALVTRGETGRAVARQFGIGRSAVNRHLRNHVARRLRAAARTRAGGADPELLDQLLELNEWTLRILGGAERAKDYATALQAIARAEAQLTLQAKLMGQLRDGATVVNVNLTPEQGVRIAQLYLQRRGLALTAAIEATAKAHPRLPRSRART